MTEKRADLHLDEDDVRRIQKLLAQQIPVLAIAKRFGVGRRVISDIKNGYRRNAPLEQRA